MMLYYSKFSEEWWRGETPQRPTKDKPHPRLDQKPRR